MTPVFETERLLVRPFQAQDAQDAYAMWCDPEVRRFTGDEAPEDITVIEADIVRWQTVGESAPGCGFWAITDLAGEFVGDVYIRPLSEHPGEFEIGWHLARQHWGRGYATEAAIAAIGYAHRHGIPRLVALTDPEHHASRQVAAKAGMHFAGVSDRYDPDEPAMAVYTHSE